MEFYKETPIPSSEKEKRQLIEKYNGKTAIVKDEYYAPLWRMGIIGYNLDDPEIFHLDDERIHIHDLEGLLIKL